MRWENITMHYLKYIQTYGHSSTPVEGLSKSF